jgi:hypothetical protein
MFFDIADFIHEANSAVPRHVDTPASLMIRPPIKAMSYKTLFFGLAELEKIFDGVCPNCG